MRELQNNKTHALDLSDDQLEMVSELSAQNMLLKDIANQLNIDYRSFLKAWRIEDSEVRRAHNRGIKEQQILTNQALLTRLEKGDITAIQIHSRNEAIREFNDIKSEIFGI